METQLWDFNIEITSQQAKEISKEISRGKALAWDCLRDLSFKLCKKCYDEEECKDCAN